MCHSNKGSDFVTAGMLGHAVLVGDMSSYTLWSCMQYIYIYIYIYIDILHLGIATSYVCTLELKSVQFAFDGIHL